ncbi:MAG: acyl-CoA thioesterase [Planctomycetota bacterium]
MAYAHTLQRRVEFAETDMAGIMHFSNYFRFMEATEHDFFRTLGVSVHSGADADVMRGWARVHAECTYARPLRYEDVVEVRLLVSDVKPRAITYAFSFHTIDPSGPREEPVARGSVTVVCVERAAGDAMMRSVDMPAAVAAAVEPAPSERLND